MRSALLALLLAPSLLLGAEATPSATVKVGTGIENRDVTGEAATLQIAADTNVYLWAKVSGLPADATVKLVFARGEGAAWERERAAAGSPYRLWVYRTFRAADSGEWTAKVLGPDGAELGSVKFQVEIAK